MDSLALASRRRQQPSTAGQGHLKGWGVQTQPLTISLDAKEIVKRVDLHLSPVHPSSKFDFVSLLPAVTLTAKILCTGRGAVVIP